MAEAEGVPEPTGSRTLLIELTNGDSLRIVIPAKCKVTYGALHGSDVGRYGNEGNVLRIYEGANQTAVFRQVTAFRDTAYPLERKRVEVKTNTSRRRDNKGNEDSGFVQQVVDGGWELI